MPLETKLNISPYFDDFDETKNFYRILFRPGYAVQTRELTQIQSVLQDQIHKFGRHFFKEGSIVEGCQISYDGNYNYVKLQDVTVNNQILNVYDYINCKVVSAANLQAIIVNAVSGLEANDPDLNTIYVKYLNSATYANGTIQKTFDPEEKLSIFSSSNTLLAEVRVANSTYTPTGFGYAVHISEGTIFSKGHFIRVEPQTLIVKKYDNYPDKISIGFYTNEHIITPEKDKTLYDNAKDTNNFFAPGAHRLKLSSQLVIRNDDNKDDNFTTIVNFNAGKPVIENNKSDYNLIADEIARRTYEESGNYIVDPFEFSISANTSNANNLVLEISKGLGYVMGYRVEYINSKKVDLRKGTDQVYFPNQITTISYGDYVKVKELAGVFDIKNLDTVSLHSTAQQKLTNGNYSTNDPEPPNKIGTARIRNIIYKKGIHGTPDCEYLVYLFDIKITKPGFSFADVRSIYAQDSAGVAGFCDIVLENNKAVLKETSSPELVYSLGATAVKSINTSATSYYYRGMDTKTFHANGVLILNLSGWHPGGNEEFSVAGSLSEAAEAKFIVIANTSANAVAISGVGVSVNTTSNTVIGNTSFTSQLEVGDYIAIGNTSVYNTRRIVNIVNATHLTVNTAFTFSGTNFSICRRFPSGVPISFAREDSANITISSNGTQAIFNLGTPLNETFVATIYYDVFRKNAVQAAKQVRKQRYVKIDVNTHPNKNKGPWCLGHSDVYNIRAIYVGSTYSNTNVDRKDDFILDTGQKSTFYDLASIKLKPGKTLANTDKLLVYFDHFVPDYSGGIGFFTINSYPIDDANTANTSAIATAEIPIFYNEFGRAYDLRDCIDFRVHSSNTANSATSIANATENPSNIVTLNIHASGAYSPTVDQNFKTAFTYYLGRKDKVVLTPDGDINIIEGEPSTQPITPKDVEGAMTLGVINIPPYPSLSQSDVRLYKRPDYGVLSTLLQNKRYTMRDIGTIDKKIARLEYYTTLSMLELATKAISIKDEDGNDRFKNGFLVDSFKGFSISDTKNPEFKAAIDIKLEELLPKVERNYIDLYMNTSASSGTVKNGDLFLLTSNSTLFIEQKFASKVRNCVENIIYVWEGTCTLNPEGDAQPDIDRSPDVIADIDLSGITDFINAMPNITGTERIVTSTPQITTNQVNEIIRGNGGSFSRVVNQTISNVTETRLRTDIDFSAITRENSFNFGDVVQDISIQNFIRPRRVNFTVHGLKPNTDVYVFFDRTNVSIHCTPTNASFIPTGPKGSQLKTNSNGSLYGYFDIPENTFKVGEREFFVCDVDDLTTQAETITTKARASYIASNIAITKSRLGINTRLPQVIRNDIEVFLGSRNISTVIGSTVVSEVWIPDPPPPEPAPVLGNGWWWNWWGSDPIAQTFLVNLNKNDAGVYIDRIDLYFKSKHPTLGIEVQIREVENGFPTTKIVPFGRKFLPSSAVNISNNASVATSFIFDTPVFLQNKKEYCFVVFPVGSNDGYNIWVSELGAKDVTTGENIFINNDTGVLMTSSTNRTWTPYQKEDIKFKIFRKYFNVKTGHVILNNANNEYLSAENFSNNFIIGEKIYVGNGQPLLTTNVSISNTSNVVSIANTSSNALNIFANNQKVYFLSNNDSKVDIKTIVSVTNSTHFVLNAHPSFTDTNAKIGHLKANGNLYGTLLRVNEKEKIFYLEKSTANSTVGFTNVVTANAKTILIGEESLSKANLISVDNLTYSTIIPQFSSVIPINTALTIKVKGTDGITFDSNYTIVTNDMETFFVDKERKIKSYSREWQEDNGQKSLEVKLEYETESEYASPVVDLIKNDILIMKNDINGTNDIGDETNPLGDAAKAKYVSKRVVLADGQDAEDIMVILGAYKPANTDLKVYAKLLNAEHFVNIDEIYWTELESNTLPSVISSRVNRNDFREFTYILPSRYAVNVSSNTAMNDYKIYGTFSATNGISGNNLIISNSTPLPKGSLVYYKGTNANGLSNGFYSVLTSNSTAIKLATPSTETEIAVTNTGITNTEVNTIYVVPLTAFKNKYNNGIVTYYSNTGAKFETYKTFAIKIVMTSDEGSHLVPRVQDMRAICLQI
jgi:hypothetical protein